MIEESNYPAVEEVDASQQPEQELQQSPQEIEDARLAEEQSQAKKASEDRFAQKFAALSRKEKAIRSRERELEARAQDLEQRLASMEADVKGKYVNPESLKSNPLDILKQQGLSAEDLAELILNDGKQTPEKMMAEYEKKVSSRIQELEEKLSQKDQAAEEAKVQAIKNNYMAKLEDVVQTNPEYELIRANEASDLVYDVIESYYLETADENGENGTILSDKEACDKVEEFLYEQAKNVWSKAQKLSTLSASKEPQPPQKRQSPTLSNAMSATASQTADSKRMTDEESKALAAKLLKWTE